MTTWVPHPTVLEGQIVRLLPFKSSYYPELEQLASDKRIWAHYAYDGSDSAVFSRIFNAGLTDRRKGLQYPFVIYHKAEQRIIGSTRLLDIQVRHRKLEIGTTWLIPEHWGSVVNLECKWLLLNFCFETIHCSRVQLKTDENNIRSRKAIEKIGGVFEGILRHDIIRDNQTYRNSAYYSIINSEWEEKKVQLQALLHSKGLFVQ